MPLLRDVVDLLRACGTQFALIGAGAMAAHGVSRATLDLDVLVVEPRCLDRSYWTVLRAAGVGVSIRVGSPDDPLGGVVRLQAPTEAPLDVVVGKRMWQAQALDATIETEIQGVAVPVVGRGELILLKLYAAGPQDAWDIEQLLDSAERMAMVALMEEIDRRIGDLPEDSGRLWHRIRERRPR